MNICFIVARDMTVNSFLRGHLKVLSSSHNIRVVTSLPARKAKLESAVPERCIVKYIDIKRRPSLIDDIVSLARVWFYLKSCDIDLVVTITPKAGLIGICAAYLAGVRHRVHWFTGQVWANKKGLKRRVLAAIDKLIGQMSTDVLVDGKGQLRFLHYNRVLPKELGVVLANGSISGVDLYRFRPRKGSRDRLRRLMKLDKGDFVALYLGRLNIDKGIVELIEAFEKVNRLMPGSRLLLIGPDEMQISKYIDCRSDITYLESTPRPEFWYSVADVLVLPSHREGFGMTVIEAGACGLPSITSSIYGLETTSVPNVTGLKTRVGSVYDLECKLMMYARRPELRKMHAINAKEYASKYFSSEHVEEALLKYVDDLQ